MALRVVAGLILRDQRLLVQQRAAGRPRAGLWELPGGKVEPGESDAAALQRELAEELGVRVEVGGVVWRRLHDYPDLRIDLVVLRTHLATDVILRPLEGQLLRWLRRDELDDVPLCGADRAVVSSWAGGLLPL